MLINMKANNIDSAHDVQMAQQTRTLENLQIIGWGLVFVFLVAIGITEWFYFKHQKALLRAKTHETHGIIADLNAAQVESWMKERRGDSEMVLNYSLAQQVLAEPDNAAVREELVAWMSLLTRVYDYSTIYLVDASGSVRLAVPADVSSLDTSCVSKVQSALHGREVVFNDLHGGPTNLKIHCSFIIPIGLPSPREPTGPHKEKQLASGVLVFLADPHRSLFPNIQKWHTPSRTGETLLIRREGDNIVFLNQRRHQAETYIPMQLPLETNIHLPAAMAVMGKLGETEGVDYRGIPVLASLRKIHGTPWFMVVKVDQEEVYAPLWKQLGYINLIFIFLLLVVIMGGALYIRKQKLNAAQHELAERKKSEEKLSQLNAELQVLNKELESFSYSVSHDLRAPLRHLTGFAELLQKNTLSSLDETAQRHLSYISSSASQMGELIDALLAFSRTGRAELHQRPLDLNALVQEVISNLLPDTQGRQIVWEIASLPAVTADRDLMRAVLTNLFSNALKFTRPREVAKIEMGYTENEQETVFFIRDNGVGFEMQYKDKLFGVFQRLHTSDQFEGNGIGLANVRRIIQRHGGRTWAESVLNETTTIFFSLPKKPVVHTSTVSK
jgi:signal transduction histidine kinase